MTATPNEVTDSTTTTEAGTIGSGAGGAGTAGGIMTGNQTTTEAGTIGGTRRRRSWNSRRYYDWWQHLNTQFCKLLDNSIITLCIKKAAMIQKCIVRGDNKFINFRPCNIVRVKTKIRAFGFK